MRNCKLGLGLSDSFGISEIEQIELIKKVGFDAFFCVWNPETMDAVSKAAKENNLIFQSIHAPFENSADFWGDDIQKGDAAVNRLINCILDCSKHSVPIMVAHAFIGFKQHTPNKIGLERFARVIEFAEKTGVRIAFENTEGEEYLFALLQEFRNKKTVGFCWDSGHEMCYNRSQDLIRRFGNKLVATHLNDNFGISDKDGNIFWTDDLHLLPFDGVADWSYNMQRLSRCGYNGILTFELTRKSKPNRHENDRYMNMSITEYLSEAYNRACKVAELFEGCN
ncbi:MAG: sugar phosphate isomerase/epimerase [Clostridia bacterium]|nr:sugar phosphate isomerase/epimerase [Clostridia bacterium]